MSDRSTRLSRLHCTVCWAALRERTQEHERLRAQRAERVAAASPFGTTDEWVWVEAWPGAWESGGDQVGKWILFIPTRDVVAVWQKIKTAALARELGIGAKVSARESRIAKGKHLICVYTVDFRDRVDVERVLGRLRDLGIQGRLSYKTDADTLDLVYGRGAASFVSQPGSTTYEDRSSRQPR